MISKTTCSITKLQSGKRMSKRVGVRGGGGAYTNSNRVAALHPLYSNISCLLVVARGDHVVGEAASQRHALLLVNQQRVLLDLDVPLQPLLVPDEVLQGVVALA